MKKNILLLMLLWPFIGGAQTSASQPEATFITGFSFTQFTGGITIVKALLKNIPDTLNFIFDTGCGGVSLDSTTCSTTGTGSIQTTAQGFIWFDFNSAVSFLYRESRP